MVVREGLAFEDEPEHVEELIWTQRPFAFPDFTTDDNALDRETTQRQRFALLPGTLLG